MKHTRLEKGIVAVGVHRYPATRTEILQTCQNLYRSRGPADLARASARFKSLVIIELAGDARALDVSFASQQPISRRGPRTQIAYDERWRSQDGATYLGHDRPDKGLCRVVFFLHGFDPRLPLYLTDGMRVNLPSPTPIPARLRRGEGRMKYDLPW